MNNVRNELKIRNITLKNRLIIPPMATNKANPDGIVSDELVGYYDKLTSNKKFSLVILEHSCVEEEGKCTSNQLSLADDSKIEGHAKLVDIIHKNSSIAIAQINHAGAKGMNIDGNKAPSAIDMVIDTPCRVKYFKAKKQIDKAEIRNIVAKFRDAAVRAEKAGFDGIEIHSAHGFLMNQFYSPLTNNRDDEYGGILENRLRIHTEIISEIRKAVKSDFLILLRLGAVDFIENGNTVNDAVKASLILENAGIDILDISGGLGGYIRPEHTEPGYFSDITYEIKNNVNIPVILTGGIKHVDEVEKFLENGSADLVGVGRALLRDYDWAEKELGLQE